MEVVCFTLRSFNPVDPLNMTKYPKWNVHGNWSKRIIQWRQCLVYSIRSDIPRLELDPQFLQFTSISGSWLSESPTSVITFKATKCTRIAMDSWLLSFSVAHNYTRRTTVLHDGFCSSSPHKFPSPHLTLSMLSLNPWGRVLENDRSSANEDIFRVLLNSKVHYRVQMSSPLFHILCRIPHLTHCFLKIQSNVILPFTPRSPK
jgi:hypothetical protein